MKDKAPTTPGRSILFGIGVFVALALIVALALARSNVRSYEAGTPEATAQAFIQALLDEDPETARGFLSDDLKTKCEPHDLDLWWVQHTDTAVFDEVRIESTHADIEISLLSNDYEFGIFPFDNYDYSRETELELDRIADEWLVTDATWPLAGCTWR
ncbi:MAG: hypothetical protein GY788_06840 [bacterium]|nr:hypothetical protein [bacterium]